MQRMLETRDFFPVDSLRGEGRFERLSGLPARAPNCLVFAATAHYLSVALADPHVTVVITSSEVIAQLAEQPEKPFVVTSDPRATFWELHNNLVEQRLLGVCVEHHVGENCVIHPSAVIGHPVRIGESVRIGPNAVVAEHSVLEAGVEIGPGAVVGATGMQIYSRGGKRLFVRHAGGVKLASGVHVLANAIVARAVDASYTLVGRDTFVSLLSSVGHNSILGERCSVAGNVLIGGSVVMGDDVWVGPSVTIRDGVRVGARARVLLGSVVIRDVPEGAEVSGNFAMDHTRNMLNFVKARR